MKMQVAKIKANPTNPRSISDAQYQKLKKSIQNFPEMLCLTPIVIDEKNVTLSGNMRLKALKELGITEVDVIKAKELTEEKKKEFIVKANLPYGSWEWEQLEANWDSLTLAEWGLEMDKPADKVSVSFAATSKVKDTLVKVQCKTPKEAADLMTKLLAEGFEVEIK